MATSPIRAYRSGAEVCNVSEWLPTGVPAQQTMAEGKAMAKALGDQLWKWAASPGNGKSTAYFACNAHKACGKLVRVAQESDGLFHIMEKGQHSAEKNTKKRKNSILTIEEDETLRTAVDRGSKPGVVLTSMTKEKVSELKAQGLDPLMHKEETGGLQGERSGLERTRHDTIRCMRMYLPAYP